MNYPWGHSRRYNSYAEYFRENFGERIQKVSIDAGLSCPNRDGTIATGGCSYCNNNSFNPSYCSPYKSITQQLSEGIEFHKTRYRRVKKYLAYFQTYSNTYAPLDKLKLMYQEALSVDEIIGLIIGTRPDCVDNEKLDYLQLLNDQYYLAIEYGVESCNNQILVDINRGHTFEQSCKAIYETNKRNIRTGAHFIVGLPGQTKESILEEAEIIASLPVDTIKFHQFQLMKDTRMELEYNKNPAAFNFFTIEEYLELMVNIVERLNPQMVIERIAGEVPPRFLARPGWSLIRNDAVLRKFELMLENKGTWQGKFYKG